MPRNISLDKSVIELLLVALFLSTVWILIYTLVLLRRALVRFNVKCDRETKKKICEAQKVQLSPRC